MIVLKVLGVVVLVFAAFLTAWMLAIWWNARPIIKRLAASPDKQLCPEHGQFLHLCSRCNRKP